MREERQQDDPEAAIGQVTGWCLGYRPALDGMRAVAVLLVMAAHFAIPGFGSGGMVGVTMFFALSGFLITALLAEERVASDKVRLGNFYLRRAYRLLPALVVFVGVAAVLSLGAGQDNVIRNSAASLFYVANWVAINSGGMLKFGHIWSLSVEEQFYLIWPAVFVLSFTVFKSLRAVAGVAIVGALLCMVSRFALAASGASVARVTFGTDTRGDAMLLGCGVALLFLSGFKLKAIPFAVIGAATLLVTMGLPSDDVDQIAIKLTVIALGAVLLVGALASADHWPVLELAPIVWIGRISYGLYLWHFLFTGVAKHGGGVTRLVSIGAAVVATFATAGASYWFVERPFLKRKQKLARIGAGVPTD